MNNYNRRNLEKFGHKPPAKPQHAPHSWTAPVYGRKTAQKPTVSTPSPSLDSKGTKRVQSVAGTYTYYSEVDPCIKVALNEIASQQAKPTEATIKTVDWMLDYLSTYPDATLRFYASDMILIIETDAAYLVLPNARSRAAAWFIFGNDPKKVTNPMTNSPVHVMCNTIKNVVSSAAEAETGGVYLAAQRAVPMRLAAIKLGHPQPENGSPLYTDNSTAAGILKSEMRQKLSKAFDMRFYWVRDRIDQNQFKLIWRKGKLNMADYFTKHHSPAHHKHLRPIYLHTPNSPRDLQGCVKLLTAPTAQLKSPVKLGIAPPSKTGSLTQLTPNPNFSLTRMTPTNLRKTLTHLTQSGPAKRIRSLIRTYDQTSYIYIMTEQQARHKRALTCIHSLNQTIHM